MSKKKMYCGSIAIVGRPNVGKSTLMNRIVGKKISITSCKSQTTHHPIVGIHTKGQYQTIYIDTPGLQIKKNRYLNRLIQKIAISTINIVEMVLFVVEGIQWTKDDEMVYNKLRDNKTPTILVINKIDNIQKKTDLLPYLQWLNRKMNFLHIIPCSSKTGLNLDIITSIIQDYLPEAAHFFPKESITNHSKCFIASEIIREKLIRFFGEELPYSMTVLIESFQSNAIGSYNIKALILVERESQKKIVIGNKGYKIKTIGIAARQDIQKMFEATVYLDLWVKVKLDWPDDKRVLRNLGYKE